MRDSRPQTPSSAGTNSIEVKNVKQTAAGIARPMRATMACGALAKARQPSAVVVVAITSGRMTCGQAVCRHQAPSLRRAKRWMAVVRLTQNTSGTSSSVSRFTVSPMRPHSASAQATDSARPAKIASTAHASRKNHSSSSADAATSRHTTRARSLAIACFRASPNTTVPA